MDSGGHFTDLITKGFGLAGQSENPPPAQEEMSQLKRMNNFIPMLISQCPGSPAYPSIHTQPKLLPSAIYESIGRRN